MKIKAPNLRKAWDPKIRVGAVVEVQRYGILHILQVLEAERGAPPTYRLLTSDGKIWKGVFENYIRLAKS